MSPPGSLFTRVAEALGLAGPPSRADVPIPVAAPEPPKSTLASALLEEASALFDLLRDPVTTLYVACMAVGAMPHAQNRQAPARRIIVVADASPFVPAGRPASILSGFLSGKERVAVSKAEFDFLGSAAKPLLDGFKAKLPIMRAAADLVSGRVAEIDPALSLPERQTAETLAKALKTDRAVLQMVSRALARHHEAIALVEKAAPSTYDKLREALTDLAGVPFKLGEHPVLSRIFPAA